MAILFGDVYLLYIREAIGLIGVAIIVVGTARSLYQIISGVMGRALDMSYVRLGFGNAVILGLEFMVAADIIGSLESPDYYNVGLLGIIVLIRTVLSYFLSLELQSLSPEKRHTLQ